MLFPGDLARDETVGDLDIDEIRMKGTRVQAPRECQVVNALVLRLQRGIDWLGDFVRGGGLTLANLTLANQENTAMYSKARHSRAPIDGRRINLTHMSPIVGIHPSELYAALVPFLLAHTGV